LANGKEIFPPLGARGRVGLVCHEAGREASRRRGDAHAPARGPVVEVTAPVQPLDVVELRDLVADGSLGCVGGAEALVVHELGAERHEEALISAPQ